MAGEQPHQCGQCKHYFITHDPGRPYGCRALSFKSRINPARVVLENSGMYCQLYCAKKTGCSAPGIKKIA